MKIETFKPRSFVLSRKKESVNLAHGMLPYPKPDKTFGQQEKDGLEYEYK